MYNALAAPLPLGPPSRARAVRAARVERPGLAGDRDASLQFVEMLDAYRDHGGLARVQELLMLFKQHGGPDLATIARWIVKREVICFEWQGQTWFPLFQLNRAEVAPHGYMGTVLAELSPVYDTWDLAYWFARANPWLADKAPVTKIASDTAAVVYAARADRFAVSG